MQKLLTKYIINAYHIYPTPPSGRIWHKVNFFLSVFICIYLSMFRKDTLVIRYIVWL